MARRKQLLYYILMTAYLLGIKDGYIALWKDSSPEPVHIFPYQASMLPEKDQQALQKGIRINEDSQLVKLLEDYLS